MAKIKKIGANLLTLFSGSFRSQETLPSEFSDLKPHMKKEYTDFMF